MTENVAYGYSTESAQRELSNEYQNDRVRMFSKNVCILVLWTNVASALVGVEVCTYCRMANFSVSQLRVLRESFPMNTKMTGLGCFQKMFAFLCFGLT